MTVDAVDLHESDSSGGDGELGDDFPSDEISHLSQSVGDDEAICDFGEVGNPPLAESTAGQGGSKASGCGNRRSSSP